MSFCLQFLSWGDLLMELSREEIKHTYGYMPASYGYVRVSSRDQNEDRQIIAMNDACTGEGDNHEQP